MNSLVDHELITKKIQELELYQSQLKRRQGLTPAKLDGDLELLWAIQHGLQLSIQIVLDIGNHILSEEKVSVNEYADIFPALARLNVIPADYAQSVKGMAGLRNLLVHEYTDIDEELLIDIINNRLDDFAVFSSHIINYLKQQ